MKILVNFIVFVMLFCLGWSVVDNDVIDRARRRGPLRWLLFRRVATESSQQTPTTPSHSLDGSENSVGTTNGVPNLNHEEAW